jgi:hypothetical protein
MKSHNHLIKREDVPLQRSIEDTLRDMMRPEWVLRELAYIAFSDVRDLFDDYGNFRALHELPEHVRAGIASITVTRRRTASLPRNAIVRKHTSISDENKPPVSDACTTTGRETMTEGVTTPPQVHGANRGWLKYGNRPGDLSKARRCGARARTCGNQPCRAPALKGKRRCRMHGGRSTGPRTLQGRKRSQRSRWKHGSYSAEAERAFRRLKSEYTSSMPGSKLAM